MPLEYYVLAAIGVIIVALLASSFRQRNPRRPISNEPSEMAQALTQLSRIADALEKIVVCLNTSSSDLGQPSVPPPQTPEAKATDEKQAAQATERHVRLSMFGR